MNLRWLSKKRREVTLDEPSSSSEEEEPQPPPLTAKLQKLTMEEARARGREAQKRKREEMEAEKEQRKPKDSQNLSKTHSHVLTLLEELNVLADEELKKAPEVDKEGKPVNFYFFTEHHEKDLDCFGDLKYLSRNDIK